MGTWRDVTGSAGVRPGAGQPLPPCPLCKGGGGGGAGVNIVGEVREPGFLEGGDYCPASHDLHFMVLPAPWPPLPPAHTHLAW